MTIERVNELIIGMGGVLCIGKKSGDRIMLMIKDK